MGGAQVLFLAPCSGFILGITLGDMHVALDWTRVSHKQDRHLNLCPLPLAPHTSFLFPSPLFMPGENKPWDRRLMVFTCLTSCFLIHMRAIGRKKERSDVRKKEKSKFFFRGRWDGATLQCSGSFHGTKWWKRDLRSRKCKSLTPALNRHFSLAPPKPVPSQ